MKKILFALAVISVAGCSTQSQTSNAYTAGQSRMAQTIQHGTVVAVKDVDVSAHPSGAGVLAGGALGGLAGANNGRSGSGQLPHPQSRAWSLAVSPVA